MHDHLKMVAPTVEPWIDAKTLTACFAAPFRAGLRPESRKELSILLALSQRRAEGRRRLHPCNRVRGLDLVEEFRASTVMLAVR